jgi:hypothetical protein
MTDGMVTAVDSDSVTAGNVFWAISIEAGAGSQGWAKVLLPSWECERLAQSRPDEFRWNDSLDDGSWEFLVEEGGEWLPVEWVDIDDVRHWYMAPNWEWRMVRPFVSGDPELDEERKQDYNQLMMDVAEAQQAHCDLYVTDLKFQRGNF